MNVTLSSQFNILGALGFSSAAVFFRFCLSFDNIGRTSCSFTFRFEVEFSVDGALALLVVDVVLGPLCACSSSMTKRKSCTVNDNPRDGADPTRTRNSRNKRRKFRTATVERKSTCSAPRNAPELPRAQKSVSSSSRRAHSQSMSSAGRCETVRLPKAAQALLMALGAIGSILVRPRVSKAGEFA